MPAMALAIIVFFFGIVAPLQAANFKCSSGDVACLIAAINTANGKSGHHTITLEPGKYTIQAAYEPGNGLPSISRAIRIQSTAPAHSTVIERGPSAGLFRIFQVSLSGQLSLHGVTVSRGASIAGGVAILNLGITTIQDSVVTNSIGEGGGAVKNVGTLNVFRSLIANNFVTHEGGGIRNEGNAVVENSTIAHNESSDGGGIENTGTLVVKNSAIIFNRTDGDQAGGGIFNGGGTVEIVNSTIANNLAGNGGGGISSFGQVAITNSTIRENHAVRGQGGGISNFGGTLQIQNTIIAGNTFGTSSLDQALDCFGNITSLGNNLVGDITDCTINLQTSDLTGDPSLAPMVGGGDEDPPAAAHYPVAPGSAVVDKGNPNACAPHDQVGHFRAGTCDIGAVELGGLVAIDIWPKSNAMQISLKNNKGLDVAIYSLNGFDAITVIASSVLFGRTGVEASPAKIVLKDVNNDGLVDMLLSFNAGTMGIQCGDTQVVLTGRTNLLQPIIGFDSIKVKCEK